ncbi:DUF6708 domain-containing protein [Paraburkholderia sp.]|uniref:DUF6708 domain-containing protein n=1 Tax=Paraburkholderia sp. TaxID=1926495 RepID=UPI003D6E81F1
MDESTIPLQVGKPVPDWDLKHRLPIDTPVGPDLWDGGTIFRINSTYMDVTEQPFMERQWAALGAFFALCGVAAGFWLYYLTHVRYPDMAGVIFDLMALITLAIFGWLAVKAGRTVFWGLKNRPIRFNRLEKKLFAIRRRRYFRKPGQGDVTAEAAWSKDACFCIHRETTNFGRIYHIRHYQLDSQGNVIDAFSIGREWVGDRNVRTLLAQWNYWCRYMNEGPATLPKPMLFPATHETITESFFYAMYTFGLTASGAWRVTTMPFTILFTLLRALSLATCRDPVWPTVIDEVSRVAPNDVYMAPSESTPVGWAQTIRAQQRREYPDAPKGDVQNWSGEANGVENAKLWVTDQPPMKRAGA